MPRRNRLFNRRRAFVALLLLGLLWLVVWLAARLLIISAPLDRADAIVILSGSSTLLERTQHAARRYSEGRSQKILLTNDGQQGGWSSTEQRNPYFYERTLAALHRLGVPPESIEVVGPVVHGTWDEASLINEYSNTHNLRSFLFVTSSYHSRRALWTFRTLFRGNSTQIGLDAVETGIQTPPPATWWLHIRGWRMVAGEYIKLAYYRINYA
ncbi:MAG: YdcF family protein [Pyrinomonadaceae bacterium]